MLSPEMAPPIKFQFFFVIKPHHKVIFFSGEVVCRPCYQKKYSCTAFTLSGADMLKLLDTTTIKAEDNDKDSCQRCQGKVC